MTAKTTAFRLVALCLSLFVGLAAGEIAARVFALAPPLSRQYSNNVRDTYLPYKPRPASRETGRNSTDEFDYDYQHNSFGFREVEHTLVKEEGIFRILGLGDSFTYGVGAAFAETYLSCLEALLNNRAGTHPRVEIIKAGIPRYFPEPERILLEKYGAQFQPDLIMVDFLPNDVVDTYMGLEAVTVDNSGDLKTREAEELGQLGMQIYQHSHLGRMLLSSFVSWEIKKKYQLRARDIFQDKGFYEQDWVKVEREYEQMKVTATNIGAKLIIFHIPQKGPWTKMHHYPAARLSAWAATQNVSFVDLLPAMERASVQQRLYYEKDGHCTPAGYAVIAQELYRYLTEHNLVP